jgi:hypothetical protein
MDVAKRKLGSTFLSVTSPGPLQLQPVFEIGLNALSAWFEQLRTGRASSLDELAQRAGVGKRYVSQLLLAFLAPTPSRPAGIRSNLTPIVWSDIPNCRTTGPRRSDSFCTSVKKPETCKFARWFETPRRRCRNGRCSRLLRNYASSESALP